MYAAHLAEEQIRNAPKMYFFGGGGGSSSSHCFPPLLPLERNYPKFRMIFDFHDFPNINLHAKMPPVKSLKYHKVALAILL